MIRELSLPRKKKTYPSRPSEILWHRCAALFFQAMDDGNAHQNPAARIGKLNKQGKDDQKKRIDPFTREEIQIMLGTAREKIPNYSPLFLCAALTGIREGELISLKGSDLDFNGRFIHVRRNLSRGTISATKNGKPQG